MADKNLFYLDELSDYKVASDYPDVRGWEVKDSDNNTVGKVDNLLVNKTAKRVVYLDVEVDNSIIEDGHEPLNASASDGVHEFINKDGDNHLIIPIGLADLNEDHEYVMCNNINSQTFKSTRRFSKGSTIDPQYEIIVYNQYVPGTTVNESDRMSDDFYNRKEFNRNR